LEHNRRREGEKKKKKKNNKEPQHSISSVCTRLKDLILAVPNTEYRIEFPVIEQRLLVVNVSHIMAFKNYQMANCLSH
jgi:hypothetical protein